jgi:hypothetical protein
MNSVKKIKIYFPAGNSTLIPLLSSLQYSHCIKRKNQFWSEKLLEKWNLGKTEVMQIFFNFSAK